MYNYEENREVCIMRTARGVATLKREKIGTTVLESTMRGLKDLLNRNPQKIRTIGEAIDLICGLTTDVNPRFAAVIVDFCDRQADELTEEIRACRDSEASAFDLAEKRGARDSFEALADHYRAYRAPEEPKRIGYKRIDLMGGDYLVCPEEWPILNEWDAEYCSHVVVIEIAGGGNYNAPHFIYLRPNDDMMTERDKEKAIGLALEAWPGMRRVLEDEIPLVYDSEGRALNRDEHIKGPLICFFRIRDAREYTSEKDAPYGAMIVRASV